MAADRLEAVAHHILRVVDDADIGRGEVGDSNAVGQEALGCDGAPCTSTRTFPPYFRVISKACHRHPRLT